MIPTGNLVVNGNFEAGNSGFSSSYGHQLDLVPESKYYVTNDAKKTHFGFTGSGHSGSGNFMVVNGSPAGNVSVWCQSIKVVPHTRYSFSTWLCTISQGNPAALQFSINGKNFGNIFNAPLKTGSWIQFFELWNSGTDSTATICIVNQNTVANGNDFGLDDIEFSTCLPNTASLGFSLGIDLTICEGTTARITATSAGFDSVVWFDGSRNTYFDVSSSGIYWATGWKDSCKATDSVQVNVYPPITPDLGADLVLCMPSVRLYGDSTGGEKYSWSTGDSTASILVSKSGIYWLKEMRGACVGFDSITIVLTHLPEGFLGVDKYACIGDTVLVGITDTSGFTLLWDDASNLPSRSVFQDATCILSAYAVGCTFTDTVTILFSPKPIIELGLDSIICNGESITLDALNPQYSVAWNVGDTLQQITTDTAGNFIVRVNNNGCIVQDSIRVSIDSGYPILLADSFIICSDFGDTIQLYPGHAYSYLWQPDGQTDSILIVTKPVLLSLTLANERGCKNTKQFEIEERCGPKIYVPNAFSPNNNKINEVFLPKGVFIDSFQMHIYNRWGEKVFNTFDQFQGWDGTFKGQPCPEEVYVYIILYRGVDKKGISEKLLKGKLFLVR